MFANNNPTVRRVSICAAVIATIIYMSYRVIFTLNVSSAYACVASISLFVAELYGCFLMFLYFLQIWEIVEPEPVPPLENRTVDVYIPTYNEDAELLRGTISAAVALEYPHKTYVLDDGNRPAIAELARELGAKYIKRPTNLHAKAGNLNHAMEITDGEFVVIFDADHVSRRDFITRLLGYFEDEKLGFIQTPHSFYNFDNFHGVLNYEKQTYWEEGELFYNVIQPGKNYWNAVSFCGSAAMFRREALVDVGLVATETITEDMHTGLRMHAKGWRSLFVNERLVSGQAATDVTTFNTQRLRWGEGNLGIFAFDNPLTMPGLTIGQRLCYLGSMLSWTTGIQKLQLYIAPMLMLLTGVAPVAELSWTLGLITIFYMMSIWTAVTITSNGHGNLMGTELTHMASFWTQIQSCYRAVFKRRKTKFVVTSKRGRQTNSIRRFIAPQCLYIAGSALAIAWASTRYLIGLSNDLPGLLVGSLLLLIQCWFAWQVVRRALREKDEDSEAWRHPCAIHIEYSYRDEEGTTQFGHGVSCDLNEQGIGFHGFQNIPVTEELTVMISAMGLKTTTQVKLIHKTQSLNSNSRRDGNAASWRYGCKFVDPSTSTMAIVWRICSDYATARLYEKFEAKKGKIRPNSIEGALSGSSFGEVRVNLPLAISVEGKTTLKCVTEGLSATGCALLTKDDLKFDEVVQISLSSPLGEIRGEATLRKIQPVILGCTSLQFAELEFLKFQGESRSLLLSICHGSKDECLANVVTLRPPERKLPNLRPAMLTGTTSMVACVIAICFMLCWNRDDWLILSSKHSTVVSKQTHLRLSQLVNNVIDDPLSDESRIMKLREILYNLDDHANLKKLDTMIMQRDLNSFSAKLCRAQTLDSAKRFDDSRPIYENLLLQTQDASDANELQDLYLSAARNFANRNDAKNSVAMFRKLSPETIAKRSKIRREFAGMLTADCQTEEAIAIMNKIEEKTIDDRMFLAQVFAADKKFSDARLQCENILREYPNHFEAMHLEVDCAFAQEDFHAGQKTLLKLIAMDNNDDVAREKLAFSYLWTGDGQQAIDMLEQHLSISPERLDFQRAFIQSTLLVEKLSDSQRQTLLSLVEKKSINESDVEDSRLLVSSMAKFGMSDRLLPLLKENVQRDPDNMQLRLQLVDLLESMQEYELAEPHLRILMTKTSQPMQAPTGRLVSEAVK